MISFAPRDDEIGERVDVALVRRTGATRTLVQRALKDGTILIGGRRVRPSHRLEQSDRVEGELPAPAFEEPLPEDIPVAVLFEDDDVLVIDKPPGLVTHPARGHDSGTLVNALLGLGVELSGTGSVRPGIVHRLDKGTSGAMLVAKNDAAAEALIEAIRSRAVERRYLALVRGAPRTERGTVDAPVGRHPRRRRQMAVVGGGKPAVTHFRALGSSSEATLLEVTLETGRTHQIRVHLAHLGLPVLGDASYGGRSELSARLGLERPFLHAWRLVFPHPVTGERHEVAAPLPADLRAVLDASGIQAP